MKLLIYEQHHLLVGWTRHGSNATRNIVKWKDPKLLIMESSQWVLHFTPGWEWVSSWFFYSIVGEFFSLTQLLQIFWDEHERRHPRGLCEVNGIVYCRTQWESFSKTQGAKQQ